MTDDNNVLRTSGDRTFSNAVMREILRILCRSMADRGVPGLRAIHVMYESIPPTVVGYLLLVDMYTNFCPAGQLYSHDAACNPTFLKVLAQELLEKSDGGQSARLLPPATTVCGQLHGLSVVVPYLAFHLIFPTQAAHFATSSLSINSSTL